MNASASRTGDNNELREFLRSRRARVTPEEAGLTPSATVRRVPGLRREEVAQLAGVSVDYYVRLERGRRPNVSESVLEAIARALRLTADERQYLFALVKPVRTRPRVPAPQRVRPALYRVLESMADTPALVIGRRTDVLATNRLARALYADFDAMPRRERNLARFTFLDARARALYADWTAVAQAAVAALRVYAGDHPYDPQLAELIGELSLRDADFRHWWAAHDVQRRTYGSKLFRHPLVGDLYLDYEALAVTGDPEQILGVYTAEPGSPSAEALGLLAGWTADTAAGPRRRGDTAERMSTVATPRTRPPGTP
ncbi:helix-turn-helix domain-containing protein [Streptomyces milbemycinicus]|uniref:Helix-turn-helix domain-containing protein n=1 Tax=Streptomyces milbemycinicus TaxID=476552 RepID=A0ABW8LJ76_9ACTN